MRAPLILWLLAVPALAENAPLPPPRGPEGEAIAAQMEAQGIDSRMTYAGSAENIAKPKPPPPPDAPRIAGGGASAYWVLGLLAVALILILRFGGAGVLTRRKPEEGAPVTAPEHWQVERDIAPSSLLEQIANMTDRKAALVRLLRHCLLKAAEDSRTRLARADTEREAFSRLPGEKPQLRLILQAAELAHYGGRPVSDAGFSAALDAGRRILGGAHG
ncbi:hypothetical protein [Stagnihabitans tardus]|uniref:DUF4129 domain-containing protein n=1 Tax=Stagnihabitans tardus TaxID=2699202 RepID=A0AAE5BUB8_9RHOB|nr:hypothetical protein [Stagnihabitans tardus]NBZ86614.1 hypothetical protein [Stagnihabitans tardus]